jgi:hypothetical protein
VATKFGLKQGAYGAGSYTNVKQGARMTAPKISRKYTHEWVCCGRPIPVTRSEYDFLRLMDLRGAVGYVFRMPDGKLEIQ